MNDLSKTKSWLEKISLLPKGGVFKKPAGWFSSREMADEYVGDGSKHNRTLLVFAEEKKQELINKAGETEEGAEIIVKEKWVRICIIGPNPTLCASPETIAELKNRPNLLEKSDKIRPKPEGWLSNTDMDDIYVGGPVKNKQKLLKFAEKKKQDLIEAGKSPDKAAQIVQNEWVGIYKCGQSMQAICASPQAIAELEELRWITKKEKPREKSFVDQLGKNKPEKSNILPDSPHIKNRSGAARLKNN